MTSIAPNAWHSSAHLTHLCFSISCCFFTHNNIQRKRRQMAGSHGFPSAKGQAREKKVLHTMTSPCITAGRLHSTLSTGLPSVTWSPMTTKKKEEHSGLWMRLARREQWGREVMTFHKRWGLTKVQDNYRWFFCIDPVWNISASYAHCTAKQKLKTLLILGEWYL